MIESWIIYLLVILLTVIGVNIFENKYYINQNKFYTIGYFFMCIIPIIISAIRYYVGTDYYNYYEGFYRFQFTKITDIFNNLDRMEFIPLIVRYITNNIFNNSYTFFYITSFIIIICVFIALFKRRKFLPISYAMLMYLSIEYGSTFNIVRQSMAVSIILLAYTYLEKNNIKKFVIFTILAGLCHNTAYFVLILYPLTNTKIKKIYKLILIVLCIALIIGYDTFMSILLNIQIFEKYQIYAPGEIRLGIGLIIMNIPLLSVLLIYKERLKKYNPINEIYLTCIVIGFLLKYLGYISIPANRISLYFYIVQIILIPQLICISKSNIERLFIKTGIIIYSLTHFIYFYGILNQHEIFPYNTIFSIIR